eukprot:439408_1
MCGDINETKLPTIDMMNNPIVEQKSVSFHNQHGQIENKDASESVVTQEKEKQNASHPIETWNDVITKLELMGYHIKKDKFITKFDEYSLSINGKHTSKDVENLTQILMSCCDIDFCGKLQRVGSVLMQYNLNDTKTIYSFVNQGQYNAVELMNDFHHLCFDHDEEFEDIHNYLISDKVLGATCNKLNCKLLYRNNRDRDLCSKNDEVLRLLFYNTVLSEERIIDQLIDKIHCYYLHSFDTGKRLTRSEEKYLQMSNDTWNQLMKFGYSQSNVLAAMTAVNDVSDINKIIDNISVMNESKQDVINIDHEFILRNKIITEKNKNAGGLMRDQDRFRTVEKSFSFGVQWIYPEWENYRTVNEAKEDIYAEYTGIVKMISIAHKYESFKEELLYNGTHTISVHIWNDLTKKSAQYAFSEEGKRKISSTSKKPPNIKIYWTGIQYKEKMGNYWSNQHVLSILIYTDHDVLSAKFSKTYRKSNDETVDDLMNQHGNFTWLGKWLKEACYYYGCEQRDILYHGITEILRFEQTVVSFYCPFSTSKDHSVAINFMGPTGMILTLQPNVGIKYSENSGCAVSWLSAYQNEQEVLFFGFGRLRICNIVNYIGQSYKIELIALNIIQHMMRGEYYYTEDGNEQIPLTIKKIVCGLLSRGLKHDKSIVCFSKYINDLLHSYCVKQKVITIAWFLLMKANWSISYNTMNENPTVHKTTMGYKFVRKMLCNTNNTFINLQFMETLFPNVSCIRILFVDAVKKDSEQNAGFPFTLSMVEAVLQYITLYGNKYTLNQIEFHCLNQSKLTLNGLWEYKSRFHQQQWNMLEDQDMYNSKHYVVLTISKAGTKLIPHSEYRTVLDTLHLFQGFGNIMYL